MSNPIKETIEDRLEAREWVPFYGVYVVLADKARDDRRSVIDEEKPFLGVACAVYHSGVLVGAAIGMNYLMDYLGR